MCVCVCVCVRHLPKRLHTQFLTITFNDFLTHSLSMHHHPKCLTSHLIVCTATSLNFTSYGRAARIANGEGAVRGGRRELEQPFSFEKKRLKYANRPRSRLSAPLGGTEGVRKTNIHKDSEHRTPMNVLHYMKVHGT